jgi:hypothetical protein
MTHGNKHNTTAFSGALHLGGIGVESVAMRASFVLRSTLLLAVFGGTVVTAHAAAGDCDRECLRGFITQYLGALVTHNPGTLPVAGKVRFTEDSVEMRLGEGLWKNASRLRTYRQDILDVRQGVAASQVVMEEGDSPVLLMLRLKVVARKITEIETMVTRSQKEGGLFKLDGLQTPGKTMAMAVDASQLPSRQEAIRLAEFYPAGLKVGSFVAVDAPFAPDAYRVENGLITAGPGCSRAGCENIKTQNIIKHPGITSRVAAVDEELGIVLLRMNFGETNSYGQAFMKIMPASLGSGWD